MHALHRVGKQTSNTNPNQNPWLRRLDTGMYFVGIIAPIMTLPQLWEIWVNHQTAGVSMATWIAYAIVSGIWATYGVIHRDKPIIFTQTLLFILGLLVVVGIWIGR